MKILTLSRPLNPSKCKTRQRITRAEIMASTVNTEALQPVNESSEPDKLETVSRILRAIKEKFPILAEHKPLAIGVRKRIIKGHPRKQACQAVHSITRSRRYLEAMVAEGAVRYRLNGEVAYPVMDHHREHAQRLLDERTNKNAPDNSEAQPVLFTHLDEVSNV